MTAKELEKTFFRELKSYNQTNFKTLATADLTREDAAVHKAFSAAVTRYFIFREKHPEISEQDFKILYFKLKLDLVASYFSEYPETDVSNLVGFQLELKHYIRENKNKFEEGGLSNVGDSSLPNIQVGSDSQLQVEQQQEAVDIAV